MIFGPQNTEFIGTSLDRLGTAYDLGIRVLQLTYQRQNWVGSGCGERVDGGLTTFGRAFVREMNELGIVVDISHCGQVTGVDAIEASSAPVIVSHGHPNADRAARPGEGRPPARRAGGEGRRDRADRAVDVLLPARRSRPAARASPTSRGTSSTSSSGSASTT